MKDSETAQIAALLERAGRMIISDAHGAGLQPVQWEALRYIDRANRFSRTPAAVTAYLGLTKGTVSQTLMALESKGLLRKKASRLDRRSRILELTAKGRKHLAHDPLHAKQETISELPKTTRKSLTAALTDLLMIELAKQGRQPFGMCKDCVYFARNHENGEPHYCSLLEATLSADESEMICVEQTTSERLIGDGAKR